MALFFAFWRTLETKWPKNMQKNGIEIVQKAYEGRKKSTLFLSKICFRITAKLAFLPPEPTYALEEDTSTEPPNAQTSEQGNRDMLKGKIKKIDCALPCLSFSLLHHLKCHGSTEVLKYPKYPT